MEKLHPISLVDQAIGRIIESIRTKELKPGDEIASAAALSEEFGVSRSVIREALRSLHAQGVVSIYNGKKVSVGSITNEPLNALFAHAVHMDGASVREFMEIRQGLEVHSAGLAALRHTPAEAERIQSLAAEMAKNLYEVERLSSLDADFHIMIAEASHNRMLLHLLRSIRHTLQAVSRAGRLSRLTPETIKRIQVLHQRLAEEIVSGDGAGARAAMERHFEDIVMPLDGEVDLGGAAFGNGMHEQN